VSVVERDGELARDQLDGVKPFDGERAPDEAILQKQHRLQRSAAEDGHAQ
jgi:hypothetical protein